ncbi:MAG: DUF6175 family protein [Bacteroidales bacterium]|nr:DUF6175 family protein [Bacteroidales bacterium]
MKHFLITLLAVFIVHGQLLSQGRGKQQRILWNSNINYEVETLAIGDDGVNILRVWGYGKKIDDAIMKAKQNAVAAIIFKGAKGADDIPEITPFGTNTEEFQDYFDKFFSVGGEYLNYISVTNDGAPKGKYQQKMKKGYKVGVKVAVLYDNLRKKLESDSIVMSIDNIIDGQNPIIMVVPSDNWCIKNGFFFEFDNQGTKERMPDYLTALQDDTGLLLVIGKINTIMNNLGFPLTDLEATLKKVKDDFNFQNLMSSKSSGSQITETPFDIILRAAKPDIVLQVTWEIRKTGPKKSVTCILRGLDSYTSKQIAGAQGTGAPSFMTSDRLPILVEEAIIEHIDNFSDQLKNHFRDINKNGREIRLQVKIWESSPVDLEEEYEFKGEEAELGTIINYWMSQNAIKGRFNKVSGSENFASYENVRIPLKYKLFGEEVNMNTDAFAKKLRKFLRKEPFDLESKIIPVGLGEAWLIIGEK